MPKYHNTRVVFAHENQGGSYPLVENQALSATNHISNNTSHSMSFKNAGSSGVGASADRSEDQFVEQSLRNLADTGELIHGDHVILGHGYWNYGYGGGEAHISHNGLDLHGVAVYSGLYVNDNESRHFVWHELAHIMGCDHIDGCYDVQYDSNHSEYMVDNITPMATGYTFDKDGNNDVQYSVCGYHGFSNFNCGMPEPAEYRNDTDDFKNHHVYPYSNTSISNIESKLD